MKNLSVGGEIASSMATLSLSTVDKDVSFFSPNWIETGPNHHEVTLHIDRVCALCRIIVLSKDVKCCSKCHRRSYCGRECQIKDWKSKTSAGGISSGQGHKSWCGLQYGEEDLDWVVAAVEGKGHGLFAKRFIPAHCRIMVEGCTSNLGEMDIKSVQQSKFANHSCNSNAQKFVDPDFKVIVLYSKRDIAPGEEICVNYIPYNESYLPLPNHFQQGQFIKSFSDARACLRDKFGIICSSDCLCKDKALEDSVKMGKLMVSSLLAKGRKSSPQKDLETIEQLLQNHKEIHGSLDQKANILEKGFEIAVQQKKTLQQAEIYIKEALHIWSTITHPSGSYAKRAENLVQDPKSFHKYLALEEINKSVKKNKNSRH